MTEVNLTELAGKVADTLRKESPIDGAIVILFKGTKVNFSINVSSSDIDVVIGRVVQMLGVARAEWLAKKESTEPNSGPGDN